MSIYRDYPKQLKRTINQAFGAGYFFGLLSVLLIAALIGAVLFLT